MQLLFPVGADISAHNVSCDHVVTVLNRRYFKTTDIVNNLELSSYDLGLDIPNVKFYNDLFIVFM